MQGLESWDYEFRSIAKEVEALGDSQMQRVAQERRELFAAKLELLHHQNQLQQLTDHLKKASAQSNTIGPRLHSIIHWSRIFAEKVAQYYELQTKSLGKLMWLNLLLTRFSGPREKKLVVTDEDLIEMSVRQRNLQKHESFLRKHLAKLEREKERLHQRYHDLSTFESNCLAARSMSMPLGETLEDSQQNPTLRAIERYMDKMVAQNRIPTATRRKVEAVQKQIHRKTDDILSSCRKYALKDAEQSQQGHSLNPKTISKFKKKLSEIGLLEQLLQETKATMDQYRSRIPTVKLRKISPQNRG